MSDRDQLDLVQRGDPPLASQQNAILRMLRDLTIPGARAKHGIRIGELGFTGLRPFLGDQEYQVLCRPSGTFKLPKYGVAALDALAVEYQQGLRILGIKEPDFQSAVFVVNSDSHEIKSDEPGWCSLATATPVTALWGGGIAQIGDIAGPLPGSTSIDQAGQGFVITSNQSDGFVDVLQLNATRAMIVRIPAGGIPGQAADDVNALANATLCEVIDSDNAGNLTPTNKEVLTFNLHTSTIPGNTYRIALRVGELHIAIDAGSEHPGRIRGKTVNAVSSNDPTFFVRATKRISGSPVNWTEDDIVELNNVYKWELDADVFAAGEWNEELEEWDAYQAECPVGGTVH